MPSSSPPPAASEKTLRREHLLFCFDVIHAKLSGRQTPAIDLPFGEQKYALFITWNVVHASTGSKRLRGCIGTFEPLVLKQGLEEYAKISAFRDRRFSPITAKELPKLECAISLLTAFEECRDYLDWDLGTHGIYIDFSDPAAAGRQSNGSRRNGASYEYSATYLPDVAPDQGWTKVETIDSAIEKSGYSGPITEALRKSLHVRRYQSEKSSLLYADWKATRGVAE